jgi:hypothetical protein
VNQNTKKCSHISSTAAELPPGMLIEYVRNVVPIGRGIRQISAKAGNALSIEKNKLFLSRAVNLKVISLTPIIVNFLIKDAHKDNILISDVL